MLSILCWPKVILLSGGHCSIKLDLKIRNSLQHKKTHILKKCESKFSQGNIAFVLGPKFSDMLDLFSFHDFFFSSTIVIEYPEDSVKEPLVNFTLCGSDWIRINQFSRAANW